MASLAQLTARFYENNDLPAADELVEQLSQRLQDVYGEDDMQSLLNELEDMVIEDVLRSSAGLSDRDPNQPGPSTLSESNDAESLLQATSLTLLPLLVQFQAYSSESAQTIIKLVLLAAQRGNPKECLMGIEQALERLPRRMDEEEDLDSEEAAIQLLRLLTAVTVVLPRIKTKRLPALVKPIVSSLQLLVTKICGTLPEEEDATDFPASLLASTTTEFLTVVAKLAQQQSVYDALRSKLQTLFLVTVEQLVPLLPDLPALSAKSVQESPSLPSCLTELLAAGETLNSQSPALSDSLPSSLSGEGRLNVHVLLLAHSIAFPSSSSPPTSGLDLTKLPPSEISTLFEQCCMQSSSPRLAAVTLDALLYLINKALLDDRKSGIPEQVLERIVLSLVNHFDAFPPRLTRAVISTINAIVQDVCSARPDLQNRLIRLLLSASSPQGSGRLHIRSIGLNVLRNLVTATFFERRNDHHDKEDSFRFSGFVQTYYPALLDYQSNRHTLETFFEDRLQTYLVSLLNLVYVVLVRDDKARQTDIWDATNLDILKNKLLVPLRKDMVRFHAQALANRDSNEQAAVLLSLEIVEDALSKVEDLVATASVSEA